MSTHMPGQWTIKALARLSHGALPVEYGVYSEAAPAGQNLVATTWGPAALRNARLIAAAPDLLEACKCLVSVLNDDLDHEQCNAWDAAVAAIAKAEGA